jgi:hypothetical protein
MRSGDGSVVQEDDSVSYQESPHKVPRKGPTPEVSITAHVQKTLGVSTRSKIKQAFDLSGLPSTAAASKYCGNEDGTGASGSDAKHTDEGESQYRIASVVTIFAVAHQALSTYRCRDCVETLHSLPPSHFASGWVQHALGRAYFEMCEYKPALLALKEMLRLEPFRMQGVDILSTTLWHLKKDK